MIIYKHNEFRYHLVKGFCHRELGAVIVPSLDKTTVAVFRNIKIYPKIEDFDKNNYIKGLIHKEFPNAIIKIAKSQYCTALGSIINDISSISNEVINTCTTCGHLDICHKEVRINTKKNNAGYLCHKIVKLTSCSAWVSGVKN